jgi:hypothetical protein
VVFYFALGIFLNGGLGNVYCTLLPTKLMFLCRFGYTVFSRYCWIIMMKNHFNTRQPLLFRLEGNSVDINEFYGLDAHVNNSILYLFFISLIFMTLWFAAMKRMSQD